VALTEPDVGPNEASGLRVPYADPKAVAGAIETMLAWQPDKRKSYGERGAANVRSRFTLQQLTSKTLAVYQRLLGT
jgi:glycosyltransferase involved in cell wall biosynthesis